MGDVASRAASVEEGLVERVCRTSSWRVTYLARSNTISSLQLCLLGSCRIKVQVVETRLRSGQRNKRGVGRKDGVEVGLPGVGWSRSSEVASAFRPLAVALVGCQGLQPGWPAGVLDLGATTHFRQHRHD